MGLRFIRQPSDIPSVSNIDDARSIRYAYGGQDGFVQKAGNELSHTVTGNVFKINSGVVVLQGWESELDGNGWTMTVDNIATKRYYSVYYEVNLAAQTTAIKSVYSIKEYCEINKGDDLVAVQTGTARLLLYQFTAQNGVISDVAKKVNAVLYLVSLSDKPPIGSINLPNGNQLEISKEANTPDANFVIYKGQTLMGGSFYITDKTGVYFKHFISYLPLLSNQSIRSAEFELSDERFIGYGVAEDGAIMCYSKLEKLRLESKLSINGEFALEDQLIEVAAKITDIYGNENNLTWTVAIKGIKEIQF